MAVEFLSDDQVAAYGRFAGPTACGKAERFQQTMKNWLAAQPTQPATLDQLQTLLEEFAADYNTRRTGYRWIRLALAGRTTTLSTSRV